MSPRSTPSFVANDLPASRARQHGRVGVEVGAVEGVVDDGGAGAQVDAGERAASRVEVRRREGEEPRQRRRVERAPGGDGVEGEGQGREEAFALAEGKRVELPQRRPEVALRPLRHLSEDVVVLRVERQREGGVEEAFPPALDLVPQAGHVLEGDLGLRGEGLALC